MHSCRILRYIASITGYENYDIKNTYCPSAGCTIHGRFTSKGKQRRHRFCLRTLCDTNQQSSVSFGRLAGVCNHVRNTHGGLIIYGRRVAGLFVPGTNEDRAAIQELKAVIPDEVLCPEAVRRQRAAPPGARPKLPAGTNASDLARLTYWTCDWYVQL